MGTGEKRPRRKRAWPWIECNLLRWSYRSSSGCAGRYFWSGCGIDLHRSHNLFQPLHDLFTIHWLATFVSLDSGCNLDREFVAGSVLEHVIVLRLFLAVAVRGQSLGGLHFHVADHKLRTLRGRRGCRAFGYWLRLEFPKLPAPVPGGRLVDADR